MEMKRLLLAIAASVLCVAGVFAQAAKKPTIMVVPSDVWCNTHGYTTQFEAMGTTEILPDYDKALISNVELNVAISKIGEMMSSRGCPLKLLSAELKSIKTSNVERMVMAAGDGGVAESPLDVLRRVAKADIWLQLTWSINQSGPRRSLTFNLQAIDAYTNKQVAATSGTGNPTFTTELPVLLEEAIVTRIDAFNDQLGDYFAGLFDTGREVTLECMVTNGSDVNFESEVGDDVLSFIIEDWVEANVKEGQTANLTDATENVMKFEQVKIPMVLENGRAIDTRTWARGLMRELMTKHKLDVSLGMKGLGNAYIIVKGSKM